MFPKITDLSDTVDLDDHLATVVVPLYLAADLIRAEDAELYPILKADADDLWKVAKQTCAAFAFEEIEDLYGINDMGNDG